MSKNTSISLGPYFENFVQDSVNKGRYQNVSEVIRAGLRLLEEEESKAQNLKSSIEEGIQSGEAKNFDPLKHLEGLKKKQSKNG